MARSCVVRRQANFFCWNFLSELSAPTSRLLFSFCLAAPSLSKHNKGFLFFSSRIIPAPASQGIIIIAEYFLEDMSSTPLSTSLGHDEGERFLRLFPVTRPEVGFVNTEHLALSSGADQTAAFGCELKEGEDVGLAPCCSTGCFHVWSVIRDLATLRGSTMDMWPPTKPAQGFPWLFLV